MTSNDFEVSLNPKENYDDQDYDQDKEENQDLMMEAEDDQDILGDEPSEELKLLESAGQIKVEQLYYNIVRKTRFACGKFQVLMCGIILIGMNGFSYINLGLAFYELAPYFNCWEGELGKDGPMTENCSPTTICAGESTTQIPFEVVWTDQTSLHNWYEQLDLICYPKWHIGLIGTAFFVGWASTILFLPKLADKYGRKWVFLCSLLVTFIDMLLLIFVSTRINETIAYMFIAGAASSGRTTTGFIYSSEFLAPKWRIAFGTMFLVSTAFSGLQICLYFEYQPDQEYRHVACIGTITTAIGFILCAIYVEESPLWQLKKGKYKEAQKTLRRMMKMNKVKVETEEDIVQLGVILEREKYNQEAQAKMALGTMSYFRNTTIRRNLLLMGALWCITWFDYYIFKFQLKYLPGNIFKNFSTDACAQIIAIIGSGILYRQLKFQKTMTILFTISITGGFCVLFLGHSHEHLMPLFVGLAKFGVAGSFLLLLTSTLEMFPIVFAVQALSFMNFGGRLFTGIGPQVAEQPEPIPMIVFISLGCIALVLIWFTKPLSDQKKELIEQEANQK